jgi:hypothetical protein
MPRKPKTPPVELPAIPAELLEQFGSGPMTAEAINAATLDKQLMHPATQRHTPGINARGTLPVRIQTGARYLEYPAYQFDRFACADLVSSGWPGSIIIG